MACIAWKDVPSSQSEGLCTQGQTVASCPSANVIGTCTFTVTAERPSYSYTETFYAAPGFTCATAKASCTSQTSAVTATFPGDGC
jgi:hypothetical protein